MELAFVDILLILLVVAGSTKALAFFASKAGAMTLPECRAVARTALKSG